MSSTAPDATPRTAAARPGPRPIVGLFVVGASLTLWWPAFVLGAWHTLFFDQVLAVWVASVAALVVLLLQPRPHRGRAWKAALLTIPSLWLVLAFLPLAGDLVSEIVQLLAIAVALVGLPFSLWVLVSIVWPDFGHDVPRRLRVVAVAAILGIGVVAYLLGANNPRFLTCEEFAIAGMSEPPGCTPAAAH